MFNLLTKKFYAFLVFIAIALVGVCIFLLPQRSQLQASLTSFFIPLAVYDASRSDYPFAMATGESFAFYTGIILGLAGLMVRGDYAEASQKFVEIKPAVRVSLFFVFAGFLGILATQELHLSNAVFGRIFFDAMSTTKILGFGWVLCIGTVSFICTFFIVFFLSILFNRATK